MKPEDFASSATECSATGFCAFLLPIPTVLAPLPQRIKLSFIVTISPDNWRAFFQQLSHWYGSGGEEWISRESDEVSVGDVRAQLSALNLLNAITKKSPRSFSRKSPKPRLVFVDGLHPVLGLILPPADGQPEWKWVASDGDSASFSSINQLWASRPQTAKFLKFSIETWPAPSLQDEADRDNRVNPTAGGTRGWFWTALWERRYDFFHIVPASVIINLFALAMPLFIMNVYDRVVPNSAFDTLWVMASAVAVIFGFEFLMRLLRGSFVDSAGKAADSILARRVFRQSINMELGARPSSAGNFAGQTRGYETVREFLSSLTLVGLLDFPFALMMFGLVFYLAGPLGWVPVTTSGAVLFVILLLQPFLAKFAAASHEDRIQRQSLMTEAANGLESIKAVNAAEALEKRMGKMIDQSAKIDLKTRRLTHLGSSLTALGVHLTTVGIIIMGTYRISESLMSMGALIACVMIVGRGMAPLNQVSQLLLRLQGTRVALRGLDTVMSADREDGSSKLCKRLRHPKIQMVRVHFQYKNQPVLALNDVSLLINPGEKVGIIGRAGSGKTTLLRLLNRQLVPVHGLVMLDGVDVSQLDPKNIRSCCGYLPQDGVLLYGSVKDNIALGQGFTDEDIIEAAKWGGVLSWANQHPQGIELDVGERGVLLSGGQRQSVLLARTMINRPDVLLLDEPTASLDLGGEKMFQKMLEEYLGEDEKRTLVLATHKLALLKMVDRVIVLEGGKKVLDGPRDEVLAALEKKPNVETPAPAPGPSGGGDEADKLVGEAEFQDGMEAKISE